MAKRKLRIIPLGGLGEIGKNMMAFEYGDDIVVVDAGLMFPEDAMLGIDLVIPDISYLQSRRQAVRAILITHGHEDHTGALPYVVSELGVPIYATKLTAGLIKVKLKEHKRLEGVAINVVEPGDEVRLSAFRVEFFRVSHSIPDAVGLALHTPIGTVVHTGDFKFDHTPVDGKVTDFAKLAQLGSQGVLLLLSDSTNAENPGYTPSETAVGRALDEVISRAPGRVIVASFASLISRIQQTIDAAARHERKVAVVGRSMELNVQMALELGYLSARPEVFARPGEIQRLPPERVVIMTTGTQGEPSSVLARMANGDHKMLHVIPGDTIVMSSSTIPGNEELVNRTIDNLFKQGAQVLYHKIAPVHVHGHASQEELKLMINLVKPRFFVPVHGEFRHLKTHAQLAESLGIPKENVCVLSDGQVLELTANSAHLHGTVPAGYVYVDGLGVGDIGTVVLRDRKVLAQDGILVVILTVDKHRSKIVGRPDIVSRGFVFMRESEELIERAKDAVVHALDHKVDRIAEWSLINAKVKDTLSAFLYEQTKRRPMILPVVVEV